VLQITDKICATDRTCCLLEHTTRMFNFIAELLDRHDGTSALRSSSFDHRQGVGGSIVGAARAESASVWTHTSDE